MKTVFSLTTWGNAGVPWLIDCVNLHPQLHAWTCLLHGAYSPLNRQMEAVDYLDCLGRVGWAEHTACGDIHGVSPYDFAQIKTAFGDVFRGGHLVGHPVTRVAGSLAFSKEIGRVWKHKELLELWALDPAAPMARQMLDVLGEDGDHIPVHYVNCVNSVTAFHIDGHFVDPTFKLEALLSNDDEWARLVDYISRGQVNDYGTLWRQLEGKVANVAHQALIEDPASTWAAFPDYVRNTFTTFLSEDARLAYEALGYDLGFIR